MSLEEVKWETLMRLYNWFHRANELPPRTFDAAVNKLIDLAEKKVKRL